MTLINAIISIGIIVVIFIMAYAYKNMIIWIQRLEKRIEELERRSLELQQSNERPTPNHKEPYPD